MVQVVQRCIAVDHDGMHIGILQKPSCFPCVVGSDLLKECRIKSKSSRCIGLVIYMTNGIRKAGFRNQYPPGMYFLLLPETAVFKKSGLHKVDAKIVVVFGLTNGTGIAIALVTYCMVYIRRKQYANISEHVLKVTKHMPGLPMRGDSFPLRCVRKVSPLLFDANERCHLPKISKIPKVE